MQEGYIQFNCHHICKTIFATALELSVLNQIRSNLIRLGMIGKIKDGPGFGNISWRKTGNTFVITGTNTGHLGTLLTDALSLVTHVDVEKNAVYCTGKIKASSESMSHYAIYRALPEVNSVIHIHHQALWNTYLQQLPTTDSNATYGTPKMADEIAAKVQSNLSDNVIILGGHTDGILVYGSSLEHCYQTILKIFSTMDKKTNQ